MSSLPIKATDRPLRPGDLNARVTGVALEVPRQVADAVRGQDIRTSLQLLSYGQAFPSSIGAALGWSGDQVSTAVERLSRQLGAGKPPRRIVAFGARNPKELGPR